MAKLGDVCSKATSNIAQKDLNGRVGTYPIYGASGFIANVDFYQQEKPYIAVVKDGAGVGRVMKLPAKSSVIGTMQYIIPHENVDVSYLAYAMENMNLAKYYTGATIPHIYFKDYQKEELPVPSLEEQRQIVAVLDKVTDLIAKRRPQLDKLDLLVKSRFVEMFGDPMTNSYHLPEMILGSILTTEPQNGLYKPQSDYVSDETGIPILRIDGFYDGEVSDFLSLKRLRCSEEEKVKYALHENDIVINRVNSIEYLGKCGLIQGLLEDTVFESNMMRLHVDEKRFDPIYITQLLCSEFTYRQIMKCAKKAVNQASINQKDVQSLVVYMPPLKDQKQFAHFVIQIRKLKLSIEISLKKFEILKQSLMQQYFKSDIKQ